MLTIYYTCLIAWVVNAFFDSFTDNSPWEGDGVSADDAIDYFILDVIGQGTLGSDGKITRMVGANVAYTALIWFIIFMGTGFGVKWTGRLTYFTMVRCG
jgi:SNF family Na+-dependent transporter